MRYLAALVILLPFYPLCAAAFEGSLEFSAEEKALHERTLDQMLASAHACMQADFNYHSSFFREHGISPFYGANSEFAGKSESGRRRMLKKKGVDPDLVNQMQMTSCVGFVVKCLEKGFHDAGQQSIWAKLKTFLKENNAEGMALQEGLQRLGWKLLFWLPDERRNHVRALYEEREDPSNKMRFWGYHDERLKSVRERGMYLANHVDNATLLLNFGPTVPEFLKTVPFYVGTAHGAYHVFGGGNGRVLEAHAYVDIDDPKSLDDSWFNPMNSEGPTEGMLFSGLIAVPARYLK